MEAEAEPASEILFLLLNLDDGQTTNKGECFSESSDGVCVPVHKLLQLFSDCEQLMATNSLDHLESH
jgi:hypothetical protein